MDEALKLKTTSIRLSNATIAKMKKYHELTGLEQSTIIRLLIEDELPEPLFSKELYEDSCASKWIAQGLSEERLIGVVCSLLDVAFKEHPQMVKQYTMNLETSPVVLDFDHRRASPSLFILITRLLNAIATLHEGVATQVLLALADGFTTSEVIEKIEILKEEPKPDSSLTNT
jgi:hypothetical protein